jgi:hypothetical protein
MKRFSIKSMTAICLLVIMGAVSSCKKETKEMSTAEQQPNGSDKVFQTMGSGDMVDFNTLSNQQYSQTMAETNFGSLVTDKVWKLNQTYITSNTLKITIPAGDVNQGFYSAFNIAEGTSYEVVFDVKFASGFDFKEGGKLGFGFGTGDVVTGGNIPTGNGGSVRMMWARSATNKVIFKPYLYYTNMKDAESYPPAPYHYGTNVKNDAYYPRDGTALVANTWYKIKIRVTSNDDTQYNGRIQIKVGSLTSQTTILDTYGINWGNSWKRKVFQLLFDTFRGGENTTAWQSTNPSNIYYDNIKFTKDPTATF